MKVTVVEYNPEWPRLFEVEAEHLRAVFGDQLMALHHMGSTAVPGLAAKPIIDILPVVRKIDEVDRFNGSLARLGYEAKGEFGIPGRRYFRKGGDCRTHQLHVFQHDNRHEVDRHLAVRDYLRAHPSEAARYGALKRSLAQQFPDDIEAYMDGKDGYVKALEAVALQWWKNAGREQT